MGFLDPGIRTRNCHRSYIGSMGEKQATVAIVAAFALGICFGWLFTRHYADATSPRMDGLLRDSIQHAQWAERRDEYLDSIRTAFYRKDSALYWTREQLEYAISHRRPSRIAGSDSLLREIRRAVGDTR